MQPERQEREITRMVHQIRIVVCRAAGVSERVSQAQREDLHGSESSAIELDIFAQFQRRNCIFSLCCAPHWERSQMASEALNINSELIEHAVSRAQRIRFGWDGPR